MKTPPISFRPFVRVALTLSCSFALASGGCAAGDDDITGSESHFVRCEEDADCPEGTCEATYCEVDGERITSLGVSAGDPSASSEFERNCEVLSRTPITLADLELEAADLELVATTLPFRWSSAGWEDSLQIEPVQASSDITLEVSVLEGTAVHLERKWNGNGFANCFPVEQVQLAYRVYTSDGMFDEAGEITHTLSDQNHYLSFSIGALELGGSLKITPLRSNLQANVTFSIWWPQPELSGSVSLSVSETDTNDGSSEGSGDVGSGQFSRTGCLPRTYYADELTRFGERTVAEELAEFTKQTTLRGVWEDSGEVTELTLDTSVGSNYACHDGNRLELPVALQLASADGKLSALDLSGTFHLLRAEGEGAVIERQATGSARLTCGQDQNWAVQNVSCDDDATVDVSYVFTTYAGRPIDDSGSLELHVYTDPDPGPADDVMRMALSPSTEP